MNETNQMILQQAPAVVSACQKHWPALMMAAATATHVAHMAWPSIKAAWPYLRDNGGAFGVLKTFLFGKPTSAAIPAAVWLGTNQPKQSLPEPQQQPAQPGTETKIT